MLCYSSFQLMLKTTHRCSFTTWWLMSTLRRRAQAFSRKTDRKSVRSNGKQSRITRIWQRVTDNGRFRRWLDATHLVWRCKSSWKHRPLTTIFKWLLLCQHRHHLCLPTNKHLLSLLLNKFHIFSKRSKKKIQKSKNSKKKQYFFLSTLIWRQPKSQKH